MDEFKDYYNTAVDIANGTLCNIETKHKLKDCILKMCYAFANQYEQDEHFKKAADAYIKGQCVAGR